MLLEHSAVAVPAAPHTLVQHNRTTLVHPHTAVLARDKLSVPLLMAHRTGSNNQTCLSPCRPRTAVRHQCVIHHCRPHRHVNTRCPHPLILRHRDVLNVLSTMGQWRDMRSLLRRSRPRAPQQPPGLRLLCRSIMSSLTVPTLANPPSGQARGRCTAKGVGPGLVRDGLPQPQVPEAPGHLELQRPAGTVLRHLRLALLLAQQPVPLDGLAPSRESL